MAAPLVDTETVAGQRQRHLHHADRLHAARHRTVTGTYQWDASYSGDTNNNAVSDNNDANEQVVVSPASPTIRTTPSPTAVTLGTSTVTLNDTAVLTGGYRPHRHHHLQALRWAARMLDTETVTVNGNGTYTTPTGYTLPDDRYGDRHL